MTDEERAEEYVDTLLNKDDPELDKFLNENLGDLELNKKQAGTLLGIIKGVGICSYLAGLKAGKETAEADLATVAYMQGAERYKPKWHKVSEQIPTEEKQYLLKFNDGTIDVFYVGIDGNLEPFIVTRECFDFYKDVEKWCEIPKE